MLFHLKIRLALSDFESQDYIDMSDKNKKISDKSAIAWEKVIHNFTLYEIN